MVAGSSCITKVIYSIYSIYTVMYGLKCSDSNIILSGCISVIAIVRVTTSIIVRVTTSVIIIRVIRMLPFFTAAPLLLLNSPHTQNYASMHDSPRPKQFQPMRSRFHFTHLAGTWTMHMCRSMTDIDMPTTAPTA